MLKRRDRIVIVAVLCAVVCAGALFTVYFEVSARRTLRAEITQQLTDLVHIKSGELADWRRDRLAEAKLLASSPHLVSSLAAAATHSGHRTGLAQWLLSTRETLDCVETALLDRDGRVVAASGKTSRVSLPPLPFLRTVAQSGVPTLSELYLNVEGRPRIALLAPIGDGEAALLLEFDPERRVYPTLRAWPTPRASAEMILFHRVGDEVVFLSDLRHRRNTALRQHVPLSRTNVLSVQGALGARGFVEGVDFVGAPAMGVIQPVPGTDWLLLARVSPSELYRGTLGQSLLLGVGLVGLVVAIASVAVLSLRRMRVQHYKALYESEQDRNVLLQRYEALTRAANDMIFLIDESGTVLEANDRAVEVYGYSREEFHGMSITALRLPGDNRSYSRQFEYVRAHGSLLFETMHHTRAGREFPVEVSSCVVSIDGQRYLQSIVRDVTERKRLDSELRQTVDRLQLLIDASPAAILTVASNGVVTGWNKEAENLFGWTQSEVTQLGDQFFRELERAADLALLSAGPLRDRSMRVTLRGAHEADVRVSTAPIRDDSGAVTELVVVMLDVTSEKRAAAAMERSESRFRAIFEQASVGVALADEDGTLVQVNRQFAALAGFAPAVLVGRNIELLIHPTDIDAYRAQLQSLEREGANAIHERRWRRNDGATLWVNEGVTRYRTAADDFRGLIFVVEDMTARRLAEESARNEAAHFRRMLDSAPDGVIVHVGTHIRYINAQALHTLGAQSETDLLGTSYLDRVHPDERETSMARVRTVLEERRAVPLIERRFLRMDGTVVWCEVAAVAIEFDRKDSVLVIFRDIDERLRAQQEKERLEQQLLQAQKLESIGLLAGGVAHDFNNHLTVINGYCDLLLSDPELAESMRARIDDIHHAGLRAADLTRQLLAFSRKEIIAPRPTRLNDVVSDAERLIRPLIGEDIELKLNLDARTATVLADLSQLRQAVVNLAVNARDAMPRGGQLSLETRNVVLDAHELPAGAALTPGAYALLTVADTGVGMDRETQRRIFEPFFTTKNAGRGTGLGLSMVYGLVRQMGGWISVLSEPGCGATFHLYLPSIDDEAADAPAVATVNEVGLGDETILVVEDQSAVRQLTTRILERFGYHVLSAADGAEALRIADQMPARIDLLVTDVVMPGLSGRDLARILLQRRAELRVLYVSGYTANLLSDGDATAASFHFLPKPFTPEQLGWAVRAALDAEQ